MTAESDQGNTGATRTGQPPSDALGASREALSRATDRLAEKDMLQACERMIGRPSEPKPESESGAGDSSPTQPAQ